MYNVLRDEHEIVISYNENSIDRSNWEGESEGSSTRILLREKEANTRRNI